MPPQDPRSSRDIAPHPSVGPRLFRWDDFTLDLKSGFLRQGGVEVALRPKAFEVLAYLVRHHGTLVSKNQLVEAVWADAAVTDNSLAQCLVEIRRALGDADQSVVRTVARRGYMFQANVVHAMPDPTPVVVDRSLRPVDYVEAHPPAIPGRHSVFLLGGLSLVLALAVAGLLALLVGRSDSSAEPPLQLTNFTDSVRSPALSNDGRVLTFVRGGFFGSVAAVGGEVYTRVLPNGPLEQLTSDGVTKDHPFFSPDDSRIVYTVGMPGLRWDSWQVPAFGGKATPFLPNASGVRWLDDRRLVYATIMSGAHMGLASSTESRTDYRDVYFPPTEDGMVHRTAPSPDGRWLLGVEMRGGTWLPCRLLPADGSSIGRPVGPLDGQCTSAAWSADGRWMYFSSNVDGYHLWRQKYPDGNPEQVTFGPTEQEGTALTPDGKYVITALGLQQASVWLHDQGNESRLTDERYVGQPSFTRSGRKLLYLVRTDRSRGHSGELWSMDLQSRSKERVLPGLVVANYSLSRDDRDVVYTISQNEDGDGIWLADLEHRRPPRRLVRGSHLRAFFGAPGEIIYTAPDNRLYRMRADGSGAARLSDEVIAYLSNVSPDGRWAVIIVPQKANGDGTALRFQSLRGEGSVEVCNEACSVGPRSFEGAPAFNWSPDGQWLYVNLVLFGNSVQRTVVLPYRSDTAFNALYPAGLRFEKDVAANPGARIVSGLFVYPGPTTASHVLWRPTTQSNLYRLRLPD